MPIYNTNISKLTILLAIVLPLCFMASCGKKEVRYADFDLYKSLAKYDESTKDFITPSRLDTIQVEDCNYRIKFFHNEPLSNIPFYFMYTTSADIYETKVYRYSLLNNNSVRYCIFEYPKGGWHNYIRLRSTAYPSFYKGFVIKWINRSVESKLEDIGYSNGLLPETYNWHIDQFTDTIYSTLPKHVIEREFPKFRGVYKYLDLRVINLRSQVKYTKPDSMSHQIEFEFND